MKYSNEIIENLMQKHRSVLGREYGKYKNHVYRVFFNCLLMDGEKMNEEKYAIAAVFHDIGIWTNNTIDYLDPSIEQAQIYLTQMDKLSMMEEINLMIYWHHKISKYHGKHKSIVENFRRADWIDVSLGVLNFGFERKKIKAIRLALPNLGFHLFLLRRIIKNFPGHPLNPLPMFK